MASRGTKQTARRAACRLMAWLPRIAWAKSVALALMLPLMLGGCFSAAIPDRKVTVAETPKPAPPPPLVTPTATVRAHERAHGIAQHATIREERARQVALVNRVFDNFGSDPESSAMALAKSKITLASFSRSQEFEADGIGVGIAARAGFDPYG